MFVEHCLGAVDAHHGDGDRDARVVEPEERGEEFRPGQLELLVEGEDDEEAQHAQGEQVGVHECQLCVAPKVVGLGELPVEQSGDHSQNHVDVCRYVRLPHLRASPLPTKCRPDESH